MKRVFHFLQSNSGINILFVFIFLFFLIFSIIRIGSIETSFNQMAGDFEDDWDYYAKHARDIKENGILMTGVNADYVIPAGFFYNYFLAACIFIFGNNVGVIFLLHSLLLSAAIWMTYRLFKEEIKKEHGFLFILGLFVIAVFDVYKHYTFLLLSENLAVFTIPAFLLFFKNGIQNKKTISFLLAGLFLGISVLTRPTLLPFCILLLLSIPFVVKKNYFGMKNAFALTSVFMLVFLLLPIRNYFVTGNFTLLPVNGTFADYMQIANPLSFASEPMAFLAYYLKKFLFCLGFLPLVEPLFQFRPHWTLMWLGYVLYLVYFFRMKEQFKLWAFYIHILILTFYLVIILVAPIQSYGFRMVVPVLFLVYGISFMGLSRAYDGFRLKSS